MYMYLYTSSDTPQRKCLNLWLDTICSDPCDAWKLRTQPCTTKPNSTGPTTPIGILEWQQNTAKRFWPWKNAFLGLETPLPHQPGTLFHGVLATKLPYLVKVTPARLYSLEELSASKAWCGGCFNMFGSMVDNHPLFGHWTWVMFDITSQFHVEYGGHLCACCSLNYITFATTKPDYVQLCACLPSQGEQYCKWNVCRWAKLKASEVHSPGSVNPEKMKQQWNHQSGLIYIYIIHIYIYIVLYI